MKANRGHVVPLCPRAIRIVERCAELRLPGCPIIFPGVRGKQPMSDMTMSKLLKEMGQPYTAHGFRSSFRDWVSDETNHPSDVAEAALAHIVANKTEARSEEHTSELQSLMRTSYAGVCLTKK